MKISLENKKQSLKNMAQTSLNQWNC